MNIAPRQIGLRLAIAMGVSVFAASPVLAQEVPAAAPEEAAPSPAVDEDGNPLLPKGEEERVADRPLNNAKSRYRLGKGLAFDSADGDFSMIPRLRAQFRHTTSKVEGGDVEQGMQIRRARLQFSGHMWGKNNKYKAEFAVSPRDTSMDEDGPGTSVLLDWYMQFGQLRDANLRIGQYKVPFNRQRVVSSGDLQLVDRSIVNSRLNLDRDLGLDFRSKNLFGLDLFKYYAGVYVGEGRNTHVNSDTGLMYLGRVEFLPLGMGFKDYKEGDLERLQKPKLSIGVGTAYLDRAKYNRGIKGDAPADGGTTDVTMLNADVTFKYAGYSLFSEYIMRSGKRDAGDAVDEDGTAIPEEAAPDAYGLMVQSGYLLPRTNLEIAARWGMVESNGDDSTAKPRGEVGGGLSYYFAQHPLKLQADYFRLAEGEGNAEEVAHEVRVQLQAAL
jgi:phosphate-selective porin OprO and OprP